jgi:hypothetical protein
MSYVTEVTVEVQSSGTPVNPPGQGWNVVRNKNGDPQDFNQGAGGKYIFIFYKTSDSGVAIGGLRFIKGENASAPSGWQKYPEDLNNGAGGEYIYLCSAPSTDFRFMKDMMSGYGDSVESAMGDFPENAVVLRQDTNQGAGGKYIFLGYFFND